MKKFLLGLIPGLLLGGATGAFGMLIAFPFLFPPAAVNEQITMAPQEQLLASAIFNHPNPNDPAHWAKGGVDVYSGGPSARVFINADFETGPGPDFHVYLNRSANVQTPDDFDPAQAVELGKLKSFTGSQIYPIPADLNPREYQAVVLWCKAFSQLISVGALKFE